MVLVLGMWETDEIDGTFNVENKKEEKAEMIWRFLVWETGGKIITGMENWEGKKSLLFYFKWFPVWWWVKIIVNSVLNRSLSI